MIEDETATGEGMPEPPEKAQKPSKTTVLAVTAPPWCTGINLPLADGSMMLVTRKGAPVPADQAEALINTAAQHGVTLRSN